MARTLMNAAWPALFAWALASCSATGRDDCEVVDCSGHGRCEMQSGKPLCLCDPGYAGTNCDSCAFGYHDDGSGNCLPDADCPPDHCSGHGTCLIDGGVPVCDCDPGYSGEFCEHLHCQSNSDCTGLADNFCSTQPGNCGGSGICQPVPTGCFDVEDPVCGCDQVTYSNECVANSAGVNVDYQGPCQPPPCYNNHECTGSGTGPTYCANDLGDCFGQGICLPQPGACTDEADPVCGCDDLDYSNPCEAASAGVSVQHFGPCQQSVLPCSEDPACPNLGMYCATRDGECSGQGTCAIIPSSCTEIYNPVCGCDGQTYFNRCEAAQSGVSVDLSGGC